MRKQLPARRSAITTTIKSHSRDLHITIGFSPAGESLEIFAKGEKPNSDQDNLADDGAVLLSHLLQRGMKLPEIRHSLGRNPTGQATSILGELVDAAIQLLAEVGA